MLRTLQTLLTLVPLVSPSVVMADTAPSTGVVGIGPALVLFALALALLLTLVFRSATTHFAALIGRKMGDLRIRTRLRKCSRDVLADFVLPGAFGGLVHIDYAVLTAGGILCIQTRHHNGVVFAGERDPQWTHVSGTRRRRFLNPLIQNSGRSRALQAVIPTVPVANLVVFTGRVEFSEPPPRNVIRSSELASYIARFVVGPSKVEDWDAAWMTVKAAAIQDAETRKDATSRLTFG